MKFVKGMIVGSMISTMTAIFYYQTTNMDKKKLLRKSKRFIRKSKLSNLL